MSKQIEYFDPRNPGWLNDKEIAAIKAVAAGKSDVLEIGCYCGRSTKVLLDATGGLVHAIDPLHRNGWMPMWPAPDGLRLDTHAYMAKLVSEHPQRLMVFPCYSHEMFKLFRRWVDVLFIDADHSYKSTRDEIDAFAPLVHDTGYIILDDYDLEPVSSAWRDSAFRAQRPWLNVSTVESLGIIHVVQKPSDAPSDLSATPVNS